MQVANASIENIISVAKTKQNDLLANDMKSAVLSVAGTCTSLGVLIENMSAPEACQKIKEGIFNKEIIEIKVEESPEKRKQLNDYFNQVHAKQEQLKKAEEAAAAAEAEAKAQAATATATTKTAVTPVKAEAEKK
jgi:hypothetical protein